MSDRHRYNFNTTALNLAPVPPGVQTNWHVLTFHRIHGLDPNAILAECCRHRYASVFILDRLPVRRSATLGPEDDVAAGLLDEWLARDYAALGYDVTRVPVLTPEERLGFVLERMQQT